MLLAHNLGCPSLHTCTHINIYIHVHTNILFSAHTYFHFPLLPQCEIDPDTGEHILTQHAQHQIHTLGSHNTNISEIVTQQDRAVFEAIQEGLDKISEDQAQRVCLLYNILAELTSLMFMRVGRMSQDYY